VSFNPLTLENQVRIGRTIIDNMKINGVGESTLLRPGAVVGVIVVGDKVKSYFITGRTVTPGTPDAADAVGLLNSVIFSDFVSSPSGDICSSSTYTDLTNVGPTLTVPVGLSGRLLVIATAQLQWASAIALLTKGIGTFNVAFTGANTRVPNDTVDPLVGIASIELDTTAAGTHGQAGIFAITTQAVFSGLNPGDTTITMKYRRSTAAYAVDCVFFRRTLTVIKL
jgi:hypothetical protein